MPPAIPPDLFERLDCAALLVVAASGRDPDLAPFVGAAHLGASFVLVPRDDPRPRLGYLTAMEREEAASTGCLPLDPDELGARELQEGGAGAAELWAGLLGRAFERCGVRPGRVGLAGRLPAGVVHETLARLADAGWSFCSGQEALLLARKRKDAATLAAARRAAAGAAAALRRVAARLAAADLQGERAAPGGEPLTAGELRRTIAETLAAHGLDQPEGNIVATGGAAGVPHTQGDSAAVLATGTAIVVDLFPKGRVFADCTRTFCLGEPPEALATAWRAVADTLAAARDEARPGATGWELQQAACRRLAAAGYRTPLSHPGTRSGYVHGLGHGVGFELHELPSFRRDAGAAGELAAGDLFTLEPGIYEPEAGFGVRLEDLCALGPDGRLEVLTPLPVDLDPRAWRD